MADSERLTLDDVVAIDFHAHVEMSAAGGDSLPDELRDAAVKHFRGESARPTALELVDYYRERKMMAVVFTVDAESFTGQTECRTRRSPRSPVRTPMSSSPSPASIPTRDVAASTRRDG